MNCGVACGTRTCQRKLRSGLAQRTRNWRVHCVAITVENSDGSESFFPHPKRNSLGSRNAMPLPLVHGNFGIATRPWDKAIFHQIRKKPTYALLANVSFPQRVDALLYHAHGTIGHLNSITLCGCEKIQIDDTESDVSLPHHRSNCPPPRRKAKVSWSQVWHLWHCRVLESVPELAVKIVGTADGKLGWWSNVSKLSWMVAAKL